MIVFIFPDATTFGQLFHKLWEGVLLCLNVCIANGSDILRSRRHSCLRSVESCVIYYYLYENWDSVLGIKSTSERASKVLGILVARCQAY